MIDLISRQAAIDAVNIDNLHRGIVDALQNIISELPSIDPVKHGKWICVDGKYYCSECDEEQDWKTYYCSGCGARMFVKDIDVPNKERSEDAAN